MKDMRGGYIVNCDLGGALIEKVCVDFNIDINQHHATIVFNQKVKSFDYDKEKLKFDYLHLVDSNGEKMTLLDCYPRKYGMTEIILTFETLVLGCHTDKIQAIEPSSITFEIGSLPLPLLRFHLPHEKIHLGIVDIEIRSHQETDNMELLIKPVNNGLNVDEIEDVFFRLQHIFFLCLGFYPYIEAENVQYKNGTLIVHHLQSLQYKAGGSYAHWSTICASNANMNLSQSFHNFDSMINENSFIIKVLANATHTQDTIYDITLSLLIQCVEGYMKNRSKVSVK